MGFVALAACVALAAVLTVSGVAKLLDRAGTREAVVGLGVPGSLVTPVTTGLAPGELLTAVLLLVPATRTAGLALAGLLLLAFTGTVLVALHTGRRPDCRCFGRLGGADVSGRTLARNLVLLGVVGAGLVGALRGERDAGGAAVVAGVLVAAAVLAAEAVAGAAARRRRAAADEAAYAAGGGGRVPHFRATTVTGERTSLDALLAPGRPVLLVSLSPGCGPCKRLRPDVAAWAQLFRDRLTVAVLAAGSREANEPVYAGHPHLTVILDEDAVRTRIGIASPPAAVVVGPDGRLASGVAGGDELVRRLLVATVTGVDTVARPRSDADDREPHPSDSTAATGPAPADAAVAVEDLDLTSAVGPRPGVQLHDLGESAVLLDPATGATVALDRTATLVWSVLDGTSRLDEIVADLADVFGAPAAVVGPDVLELARRLGRAGLLAGVAAGPVTEPARDVHAGHEHAGDGDEAEPARSV